MSDFIHSPPPSLSVSPTRKFQFLKTTINKDARLNTNPVPPSARVIPRNYHGDAGLDPVSL